MISPDDVSSAQAVVTNKHGAFVINNEALLFQEIHAAESHCRVMHATVPIKSDWLISLFIKILKPDKENPYKW